MNDVERNALFQQSDKGLLKAIVSSIEVAIATSVKRASDLTSDQTINLAVAIFFIKRFIQDFKLIAANEKKRGKTEIVGT